MQNLPDLVNGLAFYVVFLFSTTLHEAAHAWAAKKGGDLTAYHGGQVSLDPRPHIRREPVGMVVLPLISTLISGWPFGFASAPYDPVWAARHPKRAAWMALAGPASNLFLVVIAALIIRVGIMTGVFYAPESIEFAGVVASNGSGAAARLVSIFFSLNLVLFALNMIPVPPLDGSGALPLLLSPTATEKYRSLIHQPGVAWIGIFIAWQLFDYIFNPVFLAAVNVLYFPIASYG